MRYVFGVFPPTRDLFDVGFSAAKVKPSSGKCLHANEVRLLLSGRQRFSFIAES